MKNITLDNISIASLNKPIDSIITEHIAHNYGNEDPFYVVDISDIVRKYKQWEEKMPRIDPYYAVKCNDSAGVLHILANMGVGFDCASRSEIASVLDLGVPPERIIFANPCKMASHIKFAKQNKIRRMTFDNELELHKVKRLYPESELVIRIATDDSKAQCQLSMKFGIPCEKAYHLLRVAKDLELNVIGVSFHVGSGCYDPSAWSAAIANAKKVFGFGKEVGYNFDFLDIGGGYPGHDKARISFDEVCDEVNLALAKHFPANSGVRVIAEPGRYFVASAFTLAANIIAKKVGETSDSTGNGVTNMYYVNDGVYGSFNCLLYDHAEIYPYHLLGNGKPLYSSSVWGPTCDGLDRILEHVKLPQLPVGGWLLFSDMGAYTVSAGSCFNGFQKPRLEYFINDNDRCYWSTETEDLCDDVASLSSVDSGLELDELAACLAESIYVR